MKHEGGGDDGGMFMMHITITPHPPPTIYEQRPPSNTPIRHLLPLYISPPLQIEKLTSVINLLLLATFAVATKLICDIVLLFWVLDNWMGDMSRLDRCVVCLIDERDRAR